MHVSLLGGVAVALVVLAALVVPGRPAAAAPDSANQTGFHTSGNEIIGPTGTQFVPNGFVLECLASKDLSCMQASSANPVTDSAKISAAANFWHANFVRLQVSQEQLFSQAPYDASYLAALESEINLANSLGMVASVTLQEEQFSGPPMPTASAVRFWTFMAQKLGNRTGVFFDLYNEPRLPALDGEDWLWNIWQNGGQAPDNGVSYTFVGMQTLVNTIRAQGAHNIIVAEGNGSDHDLTELSTHLLKGSNIVYANEPNLTPKRATPAVWDKLYGNISNQVPLVMDAFQDFPAGHCYGPSPTVLPQLFSYLQAKHLGLVVWTLQSGNMYVGNDPEQPTNYNGSDTQLCVAHKKNHTAVAGVNYQPTTNQNGMGEDILGFFRSTSHTVPPSDLLGTSGALTPSTGLPAVTPATSGSNSSGFVPWVVGLVLVGLLLALILFARQRLRRRT